MVKYVVVINITNQDIYKDFNCDRCNMYSGSDSNESQKYAQWALNPASYQNVPGEQVDWAALAQQWIIMKEAGPPPIPGDQPVNQKTKKRNIEGGEADMDVEMDREAPPPPVWNSNDVPPPPGVDTWNWGVQNAPWNWSNNWAPPVPPPAPNISGVKAPLLPTPNNSYAEPIESTSDNAMPFGSHHTNSNSSHYWNNTTVSSSKHIKPHNKRYSKVNVPIRAPAPVAPSTVAVESTPLSGSTLDTAKRKQLPAWIREGLEKMEKDKLKQMEKQKEKEERETFLESAKPNKETIEILKSTMKERQRSRFESDGENSEEDKKVKKRPKSPEPAPLSHDELMLKVRHTMTEVLLNVTNRLIETVCKEELQRFLKNKKASEAASAPSGATIRSRLGLGIYGDDDSGSSSDDNDEDYRRNLKDSDDELKDTIKRKMADFQKTEREIEDKLDDAEKRKGGSLSRSQSPESNDNESQVDARDQDRKYYEHDTRQASSPKSYEKKKARSPSSSSQDSDYSNIRSKASRRSSSEESKDSYKRSKKRSVTPEKRHRTTSSRYSKSPSRRDSISSKRDSGRSRKKSSKRSRSRSYSRSRRSRSSSYKRSKKTRSRDRSRRSRSSSRSRYSRRSPSSSRSDRRRRRRSRSESSGRGKRSHRH